MNSTSLKLTDVENPLLRIIKQWFLDRIKDPRNAEKTESLQTRVVEHALADLTQAFGVSDLKTTIITVRSAFREESLYLRPVYSSSVELRDYFENPDNQKPFKFSDYVTALDGTEYQQVAATDGKLNAFAALHRIGKPTQKNEHSFANRINTFVANLRPHTRKQKVSAREIDHCFFAGRNKDGVADNCVNLKHILAIFYKKLEHTPSPNEQMFEKLFKETQYLFDGLDLISLIDASVFESEGLELIAELLPEFSREDIAPADKLAFAIERLRGLLTEHMIGRRAGGIPPNLFYIATTFERNQNLQLHPRLEVYPHIYRRDYLEASFFVTHRNIPSTTKFLLWRYLESERHIIVETTSGSKEFREHGKRSASDSEQDMPSIDSDQDTPITLAKSFTDMFLAEKLRTNPDGIWQNAITPTAFPDFLHLTRSDGIERQNSSYLSPWIALNKAAEPGVRSIAAFVVEGRIVGTVGGKNQRCLPRGIFAIESHYEDGFSDDDAKSLRIVFQGLASLIRMISHQHAPIDYRSRIASTFDEDTAPYDPDKERVQTLLFLAQKLDGELLQTLLEKCREKPGKFGLRKKTIPVLTAVAEACPGAANPNPEERADILRRRMQEMQALLIPKNRQRELLLSDEVLSFLEACPENFTWASYLACMAQTLGDRIDAKTNLPRFSRMLPGFSASGMFMAMVDGELRQVVKLSSALRLRNEVWRYRKWVRYRLVNAARIPTGAFAFETTGEVGKKSVLAEVPKPLMISSYTANDNIASDGVLVSDLVSGGQAGEDRVRTLLDLVARDVARGEEENSESPGMAKINEELEAVFIRNAKLWAAGPFIENCRLDQADAVFSAFRIPRGNSRKRKLLDDPFKRLQKMQASRQTNLEFGSLTALWGAGQKRLQTEELRYAICHGDMNSRNLTWAEGLRSFFLIDFEYTGPNLVGTDQFRLVVNLTTELRQGWNSERSIAPPEQADELEHLLVEVDCGLKFFSKLFTALTVRGGMASLKDIVLRTARSFTQSRFIEITRTILTTIDPDGNHTKEEWRRHWALMLLCSAATEFSYTCRSTSEKESRQILKRRRIDTISVAELEMMIAKYVDGKPGAINIAGNYMRHFVSAKLLLNFAEVLNKHSND